MRTAEANKKLVHWE